MIDKSKFSIAYFSMEVGIRNSIPTYSGGLGILAGDTIKSCADLEIPLVAITMLNEHGYFFQQIDKEGNQNAQPTNWSINDYLKLIPTQTTIFIQDREITIQVWEYIVKGETGFEIPVYFLDTNIASNNEYDRHLTSHLYKGEDQDYRLSQEIVLGIGGFEILEKLGFPGIKKYHLNEGHSALLTIKLNQKLNNTRLINFESLRPHLIFTTHTSVPAGHDLFPIDIANRYLKHYIDELPPTTVSNNLFHLTQLALQSSGFINAVSKIHADVSRSMFPLFNIEYITNGAHPGSWVSSSFAKVFDKYTPDWRLQPEKLTNLSQATNEEIWLAHKENKKALIDFTNQITNAGMDNDYFTICFARRITGYKRPDLILLNPERICQTCNIRPIQIIFAGKAHPNDLEGQAIIKKIIQIKNTYKDSIKIAYLENYNIKVAKFLTQGADLWLNNPIPLMEASGTSGMKAALNGIPSLSSIDGWWAETNTDTTTGWSIGNNNNHNNLTNEERNQKDANSIYDKLDNTIVPLFYNHQDQWIEIMKNCITKNGSYFNSHRMVHEYWNRAWSK